LTAIWDMSLYRGRVYLYWGPAPALVLAAIKLAYPAHIGDQIVTFFAAFGTFLVVSLLLIGLWRRHYSSLPPAVLIAAMVLAGLINPLHWILGIPRVYEGAIASGQFFLIGGIWLALEALDRPQPSTWRLALASAAWVAAAGSRATLVIPVIALFA